MKHKTEKPVSHKHKTVSQQFFCLRRDMLLAHLDSHDPSTLLFEDALLDLGNHTYRVIHTAM